MNANRIFLHAVGMLNALGSDLDEIAASLSAVESPGLGPVASDHVLSGYLGRVLAPLDTTLPAHLDACDCRNNRLLLAALAQIEDATQAARERFGAHRIGIVLGTSTSGIAAGEAALRHRAVHGVLPEHFDYRQMEIGTVAGFAASALRLTGPAYTVSTACTSSAKAIISAQRLLQTNLCDAVIAGGVDTLCSLTLQGFASLDSTSNVRMNPMSRNRQGINVGEGAAVFLLSREEAQVSLAGVGESSDAYHISAPDPSGTGAEIALRQALASAGIEATQVSYVNLHATATRKNDEMEAGLMQRVFPRGVAASGTKPFTGHTLGAAAATELGLAWLALDESRGRSRIALPRHLWDGDADPALHRLDLIEDTRTLAGNAYVMSNSFAFGGSNASLILHG
ncbi:beta-ketoacyl-[acyl-carrier-protein] synthase family protein [Caballeronia sp. LZ001]|uniref:beta-ketoacyl-[acyl-carrier-protein] synthase family protein n=1 Tax=Caballeronia sp. LZ001 TaxID=3038553 RepID=UPI002866AE7C|nr:beta-ketoacyl-[acyl-carrier-protein] synthase family protein [Caballeronia sp. LZ001]MDR5801397.1 beta-ketoacyl-[acyl-carrier-protein] synthase family protein [Caballeronia sp. LZ001]